VREKYKAAKKQQSNAEEILQGLKEEIERLKSDIFKTMEEITDCSNVLKKIALRGNPLTVMDHVQIIIENEKRDEKPGYEERIKSLQELKTSFTDKK
jgi:septal ring factor EnvC (AmiA/AmiB activator)